MQSHRTRCREFNDRATGRTVSGSLGVAMLDHAAPCDGDQLMRLADQAAYRAKSAGRDRYQIVNASVKRLK